MAVEKIDYIAILADMKAKRSALDGSITALETALATGALGQAIEGITSESGTNGSATAGRPTDLPAGAFNGKSLPDSIKLYLEAMQRRKTAREITTALREGGVVSTSDNFESVVQAALQRLKSLGQLLKFADGWGLAEWSPASFRSSGKNAKAGKPPGKPGKKKRGPKAKTAKQPKEPKQPKEAPSQPRPGPEKGGAGVEQRIEDLLRSNKAKTFTIAEIATTIGMGAKGAPLVLGRLAKKNKAEKAPGGYRAFGGV